MRLTLLAVLAVFVLGVPIDAMACQSDTDCKVGLKCYKPGTSKNGSCVGSLKPGNPARDPLDISGKKGSACKFDADCGVGGQCIKGAGIHGTCL